MCGLIVKKTMANHQRFTAKGVIHQILLDSDSEGKQELLNDKLDSNSDEDFANIGGEEVEEDSI